MSIQKLIKLGLTTKTLSVPGNSKLFTVSKYITRLDRSLPGRKGTHSWCVKYRGTWKMFTDHVSPADSLENAHEYLLSVYKGPPENLHRVESGAKKTKTGMVGVYVFRSIYKASGINYVYVAAHSSGGKVKIKYKRVGRADTVTQQQIDKVVEVMAKVREELEKEYLLKKDSDYRQRRSEITSTYI